MERVLLRQVAPILIAAICLCAGVSWAETLYVSPTGNDVNPGTMDQPLSTLERARDQVRRRRASRPLPDGGMTVELRGGVYELLRPFELTAGDSGTESAPIVYRAHEGETVRLVGGRVVSGWKQVVDPAILRRLDASAQGHVWQADLKALGITDLEGIGHAGAYQSDPGIELFFQDRPMTLSRYCTASRPPRASRHARSGSMPSSGTRRCGQGFTKDGEDGYQSGKPELLAMQCTKD